MIEISGADAAILLGLVFNVLESSVIGPIYGSRLLDLDQGQFDECIWPELEDLQRIGKKLVG